jgi:hypothetical protein
VNCLVRVYILEHSSSSPVHVYVAARMQESLLNGFQRENEWGPSSSSFSVNFLLILLFLFCI